MRSKFKWIFTLLVALTVQFSFAQERIVTGIITESGAPLPGVTVMIQGDTQRAVQTDFDGRYSIRAAQGETLVFSFVGLKTQTVVVGASNTINVTMEEDAAVLQTVEVVNLGYDRTATRATTMSAVTTVSSETIENRPNVSFLSSLQGQAPGMTILSSSGSPGSAKIDTFIRGISSINGNTDPLIVIDGVPTNGNQFRNLNPNDIETATVLKDAAATAPYGNRGANGVIVITTKKGGYDSKLTVSYDVTTGFNTLPKNHYNLANSKQILTLENMRNTGVGGNMTLEEIAAWDGPNTNWRDVFFGTDVVQQHNLGLAFGSQNMSNFTSLSYVEQGGLVPTTDFKRITLRNNFNGRSSNGRFTYDSQIALGYSKRNQLEEETRTDIINNTIQNPLHGAMTGLPYVLPGQFADGHELLNAIGINFTGPNDTYVLEDLLKDGHMPSWLIEQSVLANISASFKITDELTINNRMGADYKVNDRVFARAPWSYLALAVATSSGEEFAGIETITNTRDFTFVNYASLNYAKTFGDHTVDFGVYAEYMKSHYLFKAQNQRGLNPLTWAPGSGEGYIPFNPATPNSYLPAISADKIDAGSLSYFAIGDYSYKDKYGFGASIRRDASYRFVDSNKWGTFWSVAGRWNIDREDFMQNSGFSLLKLRASYGTQGNQNIIAPAYGINPLLTGYNIIRDLNATGAGYNNEAGLFTSQISNRDIQWEEISQFNVGLDMRVLDNRLEANIDFYKKVTDKLYGQLTRSAITSTYTQSGNNGTLENTGVEVHLRYNLFRTDDFRLSVFANASYNKNEITDLLETDQSGNSLVSDIGTMVSEWNLIPYAGVNPANGNLLFIDSEGNLTENPDQVSDRRLTGKSPIPKYQGGFGFNADYKGFFVDALFTWTKDAWRIDNQLRWTYDPASIGDDNLSADLLNAWTPENPTADMPALTAGNITLDADSDRYLYDSSFLRLKNATIGYNVPSKYLDRTFMTSLRFFVQGENLLTWTKWRGFDPESFTGTYITGYPNPRILTFGASVQF